MNAQQETILVRIIAQHWAQAVVSAANWENFWLNEGIATTLERYVISRLWNYNQAQTDAWVGNFSLDKQTSVIGLTNATYFTLHPVLQGANPADSFTIAPFEKGFQLIAFIYETLGMYHPGGGEFFLSYYLNERALTSIQTYQFTRTFSQYVEGANIAYTNPLNLQLSPDDVGDILAMIEYDEWLYEEGSDPTMTLNFTNSDVILAQEAANNFLAGNTTINTTMYNYTEWYSSQ